MWTLGIDVGKRRHNASLLDQDGNVIFRNFSFTNSAEGVHSLLSKLADTGRPPSDILIGMEATGHYWMILYQRLLEANYAVSVINPIVTSARRNVTIRGTKTDAVDSRLIAQVLRETNTPCSAILDEELRNLRNLTRLRYECTQAAITEKQRLISLLDLVFPEYSEHFSSAFGATSRELLSQFPTAEMLAKVDIRRLTGILKQASRGRMGRPHAQQLKSSAQKSFALTGNTDSFALEIRFGVERLNLLIAQIAELDRKFLEFIPQDQKLLKTIPGIGKVWAPTILAEVLPIFDPEQRNGGKKFVATAGIDVKLKESGQSSGKGKMSKRGSKYLRTAIMQSADIAVFTAKDPMFVKIYQRQRERGKHHTVALSHVANKMLHVVFSVLKNRRAYSPQLI
jgi:transposase